MKKYELFNVAVMAFILIMTLLACERKDEMQYACARGQYEGKDIGKALSVFGQPTLVFKGSRECFNGFDDYAIQKIILLENASLAELEVYIWIHQAKKRDAEERLYLVVNPTTKQITEVIHNFPAKG